MSDLWEATKKSYNKNEGGNNGKNEDSLEEKIGGLFLFAIEVQQKRLVAKNITHDGRREGKNRDES